MINRSDVLVPRFCRRPCRFRFTLRTLLLFTTAVSFLLGVWLRPRPYTVEALLHVDPRVQQRSLNERKYAELLQSHLQLVTSDRVLQTAIRDPMVASVSMLQEQHDPMTWLRKQVEVSSPGSQLLSIRMRCTQYDMSTSSTIVDAVVKAYEGEVVRADNQRWAALNAKFQNLSDSIRKKRRLLKQIEIDTDHSGAQKLAAEILELQHERQELMRPTGGPPPVEMQPKVQRMGLTTARRR